MAGGQIILQNCSKQLLIETINNVYILYLANSSFLKENLSFNLSTVESTFCLYHGTDKRNRFVFFNFTILILTIPLKLILPFDRPCSKASFFFFFSLIQVFITNGWMSDVVIVVAVTNREARSPAHGISLFLVENGTKGFIKGRKLNKIGLKAQVS